jgi:hypothetical protein
MGNGTARAEKKTGSYSSRQGNHLNMTLPEALFEGLALFVVAIGDCFGSARDLRAHSFLFILAVLRDHLGGGR